MKNPYDILIELGYDADYISQESAVEAMEAYKTQGWKRPTDQQIISAAILFNDGKVDDTLTNMVSVLDFVLDRLFENGDITIPTSKEQS